MPKVTINGKEIEVPAGQNLLDACEAAGADVPRYCYHPGLSIAGACRMCMVEIEGQPKLQIGCNIKCTDGLKVITNSEKVKNAVKWSLEYHLINHPIDCPICDQAGECGLQDYYMKHGKYQSQMHEQKVNKPKVVDLGDHIVLDKERCILCARCVRFTTEVAKTNEFAIFNRGDRSNIGTVDDKPLTGNYQLNNVDICPVGALTSKDFRFEQRVWFLEESSSVCSGCSKGCNVNVHHKKGKHIYRLKPRYNAEVNQWWMCDKGRYTYKDSNFDRRLTTAKLGGVDLPNEEAISIWASDLRAIVATERTNEIGVWITPHHTNEELDYILSTFVNEFRVTKFFSEDVDALVKNDKQADELLLQSDPYPNSRGFLKIIQDKKIKLGSTQDLTKSLQGESLTHLIVIAPEGLRSIELLKKFSGFVNPHQFVAVITPQTSVMELFSSALSIPTLSHYEKAGTIVNHKGMAQKMSGGFQMFKEARPIQDIMGQLVTAHKRPQDQRERLAQ